MGINKIKTDLTQNAHLQYDLHFTSLLWLRELLQLCEYFYIEELNFLEVPFVVIFMLISSSSSR